MRGKRPSVLVLYNIPIDPNQCTVRRYAESDAGVLDEVREACEALARLKIPHRVAGVANFSDLPSILASSPETVVFNLVEGFHSNPSDMNYVPSVCKAFGKSATGSDTPCLMITFNKWQSKCVLCEAGVPCPPGVFVRAGDRTVRRRLPRGPYIVKPVLSDASEGIDVHSIVNGKGPQLDRAVARIHREFGSPALVEQLVGHREINVSILEHAGRVQVLPLAEIDFSAFGEDRPRIVGYAAKWLRDTFEYQHTPIIIPAPLPRETAQRVRKAALAAWHALGCRDFVRVDLRLSDAGQPYVLEVNPNPDITTEAGFTNALHAAGIPYDEFVEALVANAAGRLPRPARRAPRAAKASADGLKMRYTTSADRQAIQTLLEETGFFRPDEITVAMEVLDDANKAGPKGDYQSFAVEIDGEVAGWVCIGPTPCTLGTYDVYWIAVSRNHQDKGLGTALLTHAEDLIAKRGGRISVIETSGRAIYHPTRQFYLRRGYTEAARLRDFYAPGDDKVVYTKAVAAR
jgi:D-alanine-D-alanine ligase